MEATPSATAAGRRRVAGLDGIRGLAALFVVVNHIYLRAFPGYPVTRAPLWAAGFIYGRFAVVVFIVLSGFSLAIAPARGGWRLGESAEFARRRAWRILPPYWAALTFSLLMTWFVVAQPGWPEPTAQSVLVHGLLVQDVVLTPSPNRAFWTIAIEAQLYVLFPLLILAMRRRGAVLTVGTVLVPVLTLGVLAEVRGGTAANLLNQYTPDLAVLFAVGVAAARIVERPGLRRARPWHWYAAVLAVPVLVLIAVQGSTWTIDHYFWVDMALGPAIGCLLMAIAARPSGRLVRALDVTALRRLGSFSYSLYLTHAPIVIAAYYGVLRYWVRGGVPTFVVMCSVVLPATIAFAWLFAKAFEWPFQRRRGLPFRARRRTPAPVQAATAT
jgi:peptidoglycan/LPS O-acetylase OafA/YrhL